MDIRLEGSVSVNDVNGKIESFRPELEFQMDINEPVNQDSSHVLVDLTLVGHEAEPGNKAVLSSKHVLLDLFNILRDVKDVFPGWPISLVQRLINLFINP